MCVILNVLVGLAMNKYFAKLVEGGRGERGNR